MKFLFNSRNIRLETERLILRFPTLKDAKDFFEIFSSFSVQRFVSGHAEITQTKLMLHTLLDERKDTNICTLAIEEKQSSKVIGELTLKILEDLKTAKLGVVIGENFQKQNYAFEASQKIMWFAFTILKLEKITAETSEENHAAFTVMKHKLLMDFVMRRDEQVFDNVLNKKVARLSYETTKEKFAQNFPTLFKRK